MLAGMQLKKLTPAEHRIAALAACGKTNREIAHLLSVREQTVKNAMSASMRKLGVRNRVELTLAVGQSHNR